MKKYAPVAILGLCVVSAWIGLSCGTGFFSLHQIWRAFADPLSFPFEHTVLSRIRVPRVWCAFLVGGGLSLAGIILQAILKNPLAESYTLGISGGASIGIALYPDAGGDAASLIRNADAAMYRAKAAGRRRYVVFEGG